MLETGNGHAQRQEADASRRLAVLLRNKSLGSSAEMAAQYLDRLSHMMGYDASGEAEFLARRASRARIQSVYAHLDNFCSGNDMIAGRHAGVVGFLKGLKSEGFRPEETVNAIDAFAIAVKAVGDLDWETRKRILDKLSDIAVLRYEPRSWDYLAASYPEVAEYADRHISLAAGRGGGKPQLDRAEIAELLSAYDYLRTNFVISANVENLSAVNIERHKLSRGAMPEELAIKPAYEQRFLGDLRATVRRARYEAFVNTCDVSNEILSSIVGMRNLSPERRLSDWMRATVGGRIFMAHGRSLLDEFVRVHYTEGADRANMWVAGLPGNVRVEAAMRSRGTDVDAVRALDETYTLKADRLVGRMDQRISEICDDIGTLLDSMELDTVVEFGLRGDDRVAISNMVGRRLNELVNSGMVPKEKRPFVDSVNKLVNDLNSAVEQRSRATAGAPVHFRVVGDTLEKMQMGVGFQSCMAPGREFSYGAVARAIDANNFTVYVTDDNDRKKVLARMSLLETDKGIVVVSKFHDNSMYDLFSREGGWVAFLAKVGEVSGRDVIVPSKLVDTQYGDALRIFEEAGFERLEKTTVHVDKAVANDIYYDITDDIGILDGGLDTDVEGLVLRYRKA